MVVLIKSRYFMYIPLDTLKKDVTVLIKKVSIYNKPENVFILKL